MEINTEIFFNIFKNNFFFEAVETPLGKAIKMPSKDAFIYSCVTGSGYLDNTIYPYTPKGLLKLFYNAFDYKFVTGIFDNTQIKNTPYIMNLAKPYLFKGDKFILPIEFTTEEELNNILNNLSLRVMDPHNYIIQRIESRKVGNGMEPFMEYLTTEYFKERGFIVENQIPLAHSVGSPDFAGYGLVNFLSILREEGVLTGNGFHIIELSLIRLFPSMVKENSITAKKLVVAEAKTGTLVMTKQLEKYLNTGLFDYGYEIHPSKKVPDKDYFGLISLDNNFKIKVIDPVTNFNSEKSLSKEKYLEWLEDYMKFYLLANLTNDEINDLYFQMFNLNISKQDDLVNLIHKINTKDLINKIKFYGTIK
jgi:hypothetical protein